MQWSLLSLYLIAAASYGGWRARDLWLGWGVCFLFVPPLVATAVQLINDWRQNPYWGIFRVQLVLTVVAATALGGTALGVAWCVAETTHRWSPQPAVRAGVGAALGGVSVLALRLAKFRRVNEPTRADGSAGTVTPCRT